MLYIVVKLGLLGSSGVVFGITQPKMVKTISVSKILTRPKTLKRQE